MLVEDWAIDAEQALIIALKKLAEMRHSLNAGDVLDAATIVLIDMARGALKPSEAEHEIRLARDRLVARGAIDASFEPARPWRLLRA